MNKLFKYLSILFFVCIIITTLYYIGIFFGVKTTLYLPYLVWIFALVIFYFILGTIREIVYIKYVDKKRNNQ